MTPETSTEGARVLAWARRWLRPDDVARVVEPTIADWRHELASTPPADRARVRRRGLRSALAAIVHTLASERLALARRAPWWLLAFPLLAVVMGVALAGAPQSQLVFLGVGALAFGVVATTPARWIGPGWAWVGVGAMALTVLGGTSHEGATRWLELGPLHVQVTLLALPLVVIGGRAPAIAAAGVLALAPDAVGASALAVATPHPLTLLIAALAWLREPMMTTGPAAPALALASVALVLVAAWRLRARAEGRLVLALVVLGLGAHLAGHAPMPLVGAGGSAIVAVCLAFALTVRHADPWTGRPSVG